VIQNLFGDIKPLSCLGATHLPRPPLNRIPGVRAKGNNSPRSS
jgi:hypothetical protein